MDEGVPGAPALSRLRSGNRDWYINLDGLAHYGMLPDFLQDSANVLSASGSDGALKPLFRGAEAYLRMWEKIER